MRIHDVLGSNIRAEMARRGLSYKDLAEKAQCSVTTICAIANSKTDAKISNIGKIANALKMKPEQLLKSRWKK